MSGSMTIQCPFQIDRRARGRKQLNARETPTAACAPGRVPRVAKLLHPLNPTQQPLGYLLVLLALVVCSYLAIRSRVRGVLGALPARDDGPAGERSRLSPLHSLPQFGNVCRMVPSMPRVKSQVLFQRNYAVLRMDEGTFPVLFVQAPQQDNPAHM